MKSNQQEELFQKVISEAWENETFKKELLENPVEAIEKLTGKTLQIPEGKKFLVRDQSDELNVYINIPANRTVEDAELNEEQLELVAGGITGDGCVIGFPNPFDIIFPLPSPTFPTKPIEY
ncbi:putative ribosomally synthesized peptide [Tenacibaculum skagerrakense]|uniref:Putative ribosomally synthesized peptide n=1 Tax=Tenacibaculum skagerrakense TaxID=186571 RepID=A0A4R2NQA8_9FLAO|nr:NHLP leader peptide family RiPP precursor [Tenacibaculum skagerrakense]TCP24023.1 putative ribosomally synthesized peptide [Tenacibaculum skagerrakense]